MAYKTEKTYSTWLRRFIYFMRKCRRSSVDYTKESSFLTYLALQRNVSPNT
ncbi:phage integrase N-terminal SAM-like domain-containing protein [Teredinibacter sp. KSP-S5-2]|uniref:phage integrase N-terminal SAM-like domain-containing protein n=1 Tax=Teredinibacter sp. KSP-S5-2 TaxID=3034506 RepID=UPI0039773122